MNSPVFTIQLTIPQYGNRRLGEHGQAGDAHGRLGTLKCHQGIVPGCTPSPGVMMVVVVVVVEMVIVT